jgi:RNA polymerase sigma factor (sigma-70 family)
MNHTLWDSFKQGNETARTHLLQEHLGLVHHVARQMSRTLAVRADFDELVSAGTIGLMTALDGFDPSRGLAFSTFAAPRIRGAILDELRKQDHVPRSIRRKTREISAARETLMRVLGRLPDDDELCEHLGVDRATLWRWQADVEGAHHIPLDRAPGEREQPRAGADRGAHLERRLRGGRRDQPRAGSALPQGRDPASQGAGAHRAVALLLRGAQAARDRQGARAHGIAGLADPQQGAGKLRTDLQPMRERIA